MRFSRRRMGRWRGGLAAVLGALLGLAMAGSVQAQGLVPFPDPDLPPPAVSRPKPAKRRVVAPAPEVRGPSAEAAGRYSIFREGMKDTGCLLTLDGGARSGGGRAILAPACRDQGLVIFDPVGWGLERGRLALRARKGHNALFDLQSDGTWLRDPKEGKALVLRKIVI